MYVRFSAHLFYQGIVNRLNSFCLLTMIKGYTAIGSINICYIILESVGEKPIGEHARLSSVMACFFNYNQNIDESAGQYLFVRQASLKVTIQQSLTAPRVSEITFLGN